MKAAPILMYTCITLLWAASVHCNSLAVQHFEDWAPLETLCDSVHVTASDTSTLVESDSILETFEHHIRSVAARSSRQGANLFDWPHRTNINSAGLLLTNDEQYYVQFAIRVDGITAEVFQSFTGRPLLSMVADKAFVAVGNSAWVLRARAFPGVVFVTSRNPASKVNMCSKHLIIE